MNMHLSTSNHLEVDVEFLCEENFWAACPAGNNIEQFTCPSDFLLVPDCRAGDLSNPDRDSKESEDSFYDLSESFMTNLEDSQESK